MLKAPQAIPPEELPPVARGAVPDAPATGPLPSTPVVRSGGAPGRQPAASGPAWLNDEPGVVAAGGRVPNPGAVRQLTPPPAPAQPNPSLATRFINRVAGDSGGAKPAPKQNQNPQQPAQRQPEQPTASTAFRGTAPNGAAVYAGPPAYRWYGWGSVTPGANPLAPAGQYPVASANWYKITGATPGAFPVPVSSSGQPMPGYEPPSYGAARTAPAPDSADIATAYPHYQPQYQPQPQPAPVRPRPELPPPAASGESKFMPGPSASGAPAPTDPPPLAPKLSVPTIAPVPVSTPAPTPVALAPSAYPAEPAGAREPVATPRVPHIYPAATLPPEPERAAATPDPKPLPTSVTSDPPRPQSPWQPAEGHAAPVPETWAPAQGAAPRHTQPVQQPQEQPLKWQTGSVDAKPVARGQAGDRTPDPLAPLIKQICQDRAEGVEVRWTGTKKLCVCFESRTAPEAQRLVADISARPELTAYQIDFCVVVK